MRILLVYPEYPVTFWSFIHALKFINRKASFPPLGLLTVAAMLPLEWEKKLIDMTTTTLDDRDIEWADYVFISAASIQRESAREVISRCRRLGRKIVAGGPLFTSEYAKFDEVDHLVLNEAEVTLPPFLEDLKAGRPLHRYHSGQFADVSATPIPRWELVNLEHYADMCVQISRGCPFNCEFCDVTVLFGHQMRIKSVPQVLAELDSLYAKGWRGGVFIVDDNFIGNKAALKGELLPALLDWQVRMKFPFSLHTQGSINLSDDEELMALMVQAGFECVFVGIETPNDESLAECGKFHNRNRDLLTCVKRIQQFGLQVQAGFILGFDSDPSTIFDRLISFIQKSGIVTAMVGLLNAPPGTKLYERLTKENRIVKEFSGDNTDLSINFIPAMNIDELMEGYRKVVATIYSPRNYYERVKTLLKDFRYLKRGKRYVRLHHIGAFFKSIWHLGIRERGRIYYWKILLWSLFCRPRLFPLALTLSIYGFHFRRIFAHASSPA